MKSQKIWNLKNKNDISEKKWKEKIFRTQKFQNSINVSVGQCQDLVNVSVRQYQCQTMSGTS